MKDIRYYAHVREFHFDIIAVDLLTSLALSIPVYKAGLRAVPITSLVYLVVLVVLQYFNYKRSGQEVVYYMNKNIDPLILVFLYTLYACVLRGVFIIAALWLR